MNISVQRQGQVVRSRKYQAYLLNRLMPFKHGPIPWVYRRGSKYKIETSLAAYRRKQLDRDINDLTFSGKVEHQRRFLEFHLWTRPATIRMARRAAGQRLTSLKRSPGVACGSYGFNCSLAVPRMPTRMRRDRLLPAKAVFSFWISWRSRPWPILFRRLRPSSSYRSRIRSRQRR